jgi:hypothetical protein
LALSKVITNQMGKLIRSLDNGATWITNDAPEHHTRVLSVRPMVGWAIHHRIYGNHRRRANLANTGIGNNLNRIQMFNDHFGAELLVYKFSAHPLATSGTKGNAHPFKSLDRA